MSDPKKDETKALAQRIGTVRGMFEKALPELKRATPKHITAERMIKVMTASLSRVWKLAECTPQSLLLALMTATELGLEPNSPLGHAYILPVWNGKAGVNEAQFWPGYRGLIYLAFQSGEVNDIRSCAVREGDLWRYRDTRGGVDWEWAPADLDESDEAREARRIRRVYAAATMTGDREHIEVMSTAEIERIRKRAPSSRAKRETPWDTDWEQMARKTVIKRLCKYLPLSTEKTELLARAIEVDNAAMGEASDDILEVLATAPPPEEQQQPAEIVTSGEPAPAEPRQLVADSRVPVAAPTSRAEEVRARVAAKRAAAGAPPPAQPEPEPPTADGDPMND